MVGCSTAWCLSEHEVPNSMQKLVTIYLDNMAYEDSTMFKGHANKHGVAEEHLVT